MCDLLQNCNTDSCLTDCNGPLPSPPMWCPRPDSWLNLYDYCTLYCHGRTSDPVSNPHALVHMFFYSVSNVVLTKLRTRPDSCVNCNTDSCLTDCNGPLPSPPMWCPRPDSWLNLYDYCTLYCHGRTSDPVSNPHALMHMFFYSVSNVVLTKLRTRPDSCVTVMARFLVLQCGVNKTAYQTRQLCCMCDLLQNCNTDSCLTDCNGPLPSPPMWCPRPDSWLNLYDYCTLYCHGRTSDPVSNPHALVHMFFYSVSNVVLTKLRTRPDSCVVCVTYFRTVTLTVV
ncbi:hypothetical protein J6590_045972 [Homalodisca vitripennis]|nr:hypothetical protein J6590_045972 [Homalodisca vitripennis]